MSDILFTFQPLSLSLLSDWMNSTGFLGNLYGVFFNVPPGNKAVGMPNPLMEEESHCVYNCDNECLSESAKR